MQWWHKNPIEAWEWLRDTLEPERLERLKMRAQYIDPTSLDYNLIKLYLQKEIEKYEE